MFLLAKIGKIILFRFSWISGLEGHYNENDAAENSEGPRGVMEH